ASPSRSRPAVAGTAPAVGQRPFADPIVRPAFHRWTGCPAIGAAAAGPGGAGCPNRAYAAAPTRSRRAGPRSEPRPPPFARCTYASDSLPDRESIPEPVARHGPPSLHRRDGGVNLSESGAEFKKISASCGFAV